MTILMGKNPAAIANGMLYEVHVDGEGVFAPEFETFLLAEGFEQDPFCVQDGGKIVNHWTGRVWSLIGTNQKPLVDSLRTVQLNVVREAQKFNHRLYVELELVRLMVPASEKTAGIESVSEVLDRFMFEPTGTFGKAGADIHVEFDAHNIPKEIIDAFLSHHFYPVTGVDSKDGKDYIVFTIQPETYDQANILCHALLNADLPSFREISVEQKPAIMMASVDDLQMPPVVRVVMQ